MNSFYKKLDELKILISEISPDIICLQETNFTNLNTAKVPNYNDFSKHRPTGLRASGGVTTYVSSIYPSKEIYISTHLEVIAVAVKLNDIEPNQHTFTDKDIENIIKQLPKPFIITGDFNSHNVSWGSLSTDSRGKEIDKILENDDLVLLNNMEPTRINPINGNFSNIDISFANASLAQRLNWSVLHNITSSDHFPITGDLSLKHFENKVSHIDKSESQNTENLVDQLTETIISVANLTIGKTKSKNPKPKLPWWNHDIKNATKEKTDDLKKFKKTNKLDDFILLKHLRTKSKFLIKTSKKSSWEKFTSSILKENTDSKSVWNKIQSLKGLRRNKKINLIDPNSNQLINKPDQIPNNLGEYFYNNSSDNNYKQPFLGYKQKCEKETISNTSDKNCHDQRQINQEIKIQELTHSLKKCKSNSPGPDTIPYVFIQNFGTRTLNLLLNIYNRI
ncbi:uncharacterized protein LOC132952399 [Metopolophium dirhodum]|uniref:uncharacterized protein LOC132952399 n=1 Tax=Metopolophium dirhodum TaxID=44670 RepID=UPI0029901F09|nr:uncharacterized protein LOC132952399 [Metopolophium dirhodum]